MKSVDKVVLAGLQPMDSLSPERLEELATLCFVEAVSKGLDPFRMNVTKSAQALYVLQGDLSITHEDGSTSILHGGSEEARQPVDNVKAKINSAIALTEIEIIRIDTDLLDIMMTWDQLAVYEKPAPVSATAMPAPELPRNSRGPADWMHQTNVFSAELIQTGVFSRLPPANIKEMFKRMVSVSVSAGQIVIMQGAEGDYYYLIERGLAEVTRVVEADELPLVLAELKQGDAFGGDALVSDNKRNATVIMKTDGTLLRLNKTDFVELLKAPLLNRVQYNEAENLIKAGAVWLDVRLPSEYRFDHLPNAINTPLQEIRNLMKTLDYSKEYIAYCQTGRRSSVAAFILAQHGFKASVLDGGTKAAKLV